MIDAIFRFLIKRQIALNKEGKQVLRYSVDFKFGCKAESAIHSKHGTSLLLELAGRGISKTIEKSLPGNDPLQEGLRFEQLIDTARRSQLLGKLVRKPDTPCLFLQIIMKALPGKDPQIQYDYKTSSCSYSLQSKVQEHFNQIILTAIYTTKNLLARKACEQAMGPPPPRYPARAGRFILKARRTGEDVTQKPVMLISHLRDT